MIGRDMVTLAGKVAERLRQPAEGLQVRAILLDGKPYRELHMAGWDAYVYLPEGAPPAEVEEA